MRSISLVAAALGLTAALAAPLIADEPTPAPARTALTQAEHTAAAKKKAVLVMYHASW
jgi:hypothetical protein